MLEIIDLGELPTYTVDTELAFASQCELTHTNTGSGLTQTRGPQTRTNTGSGLEK